MSRLDSCLATVGPDRNPEWERMINMAYLFSGKEIRIGLQLYSIREQCAEDLPTSLARVAEMGYQGVEFAGFQGYSATKLRRQLDSLGLQCCGSHTKLEALHNENLADTIEFNRVLGNPYLICPYIKLETITEWRTMAGFFSELAGRVEAHGLHIGYHNHAHDFAALDGEIPWDVFFSATPAQVLMQLDSGNARSGAVDPVTVLRRYPHRSPTVHLKDYSNGDTNLLIGTGDVNWQEFLSACVTLGDSQWFIVEIENPRMDPFEAVQRSLENLTKLLG